MKGEISYDLIMDDDMEFVEGTFRLSRGDWQVLIFSGCHSSPPVLKAEVKRQRWESGIAGVRVIVPSATQLNRRTVEQIMGEALGVDEWVEVKGPDSMVLR